MKNQRNQQGDMVDNWTVKKTDKHLKKRKQKKNPGSGTLEFHSW
jgi:hypothetical protein